MESKTKEEIDHRLKLVIEAHRWSEWANWPTIESKSPGSGEALAFNVSLQHHLQPKEILEILESPVKVTRPAVVYDDDWSD